MKSYSSSLLLFIFVLIVIIEKTTETHVPITTLNLFRRNDYGSCPSGTPDRTIDITDDGNCYELVAANAQLELSALYYETYSDFYIGTHSSTSYEIESLAILSRCGCEHMMDRDGERNYNRTCLIAKVNQGCTRFKHVAKMKKFWNTLYNDPDLEYWGIDANYVENVLLY